jgi:hypothetical protein
MPTTRHGIAREEEATLALRFERFGSPDVLVGSPDVLEGILARLARAFVERRGHERRSHDHRKSLGVPGSTRLVIALRAHGLGGFEVRRNGKNMTAYGDDE